MNNRVWILTTVFNRAYTLPKYFSNIEKQTYKNYKLVIIDHGNKTIDKRTLPFYVVYVKSTPDKWWTGAVNDGLKHIFNSEKVLDDDFIMLQNDDVEFNEFLIEDLVNASADNDAVIGAITLDIDSKIIVDADNRFSILKAKHICENRGKTLDEIGNQLLPSDILKGRGVIYPVKVVKEIGYLDERLNRRSDPEWGYRAKKAGYNIFIDPKILVFTKVDTDVSLSNYVTFDKLKKYLFSPRSTANLPDAIKYFYICSGFLKGTYSSIIYLFRLMIIILYKKIIQKGREK